MNSIKSFKGDPIEDYVNNHSLRLTPAQLKLIDRTRQNPRSMMLASLDETQLFQILLKTLNAKRAIEVGAFTGYTTLCMALAMPEDAQIITCDITDKNIAYDIWKEAGVDKKIKVEIGPALKSLRQLLDSHMEGQFDFAFIDADKENQIEYYEMCLKLIRRGGIIAIDNVLWGGSVANAGDQSSDTIAIRKLNEHVKNDNRVDISMLKIGDGITLCYKL